jgi:uncharacterized protein YggT (Ycf19 family)
MAEQHNLAIDEAQRVSQHESVKGEVRKKVHSDITREATESPDTPSERAEEAGVAESLKHKAVREVRDTESEIDRSRVAARTSQVIDYFFYIAYGIIGLVIVLEAIGARDSAGFKKFIDAVASPLLLPFRGLMPDPGIGSTRLMFSYMVALAVYLMVHLAINGLLRLVAQRKTVV